VGGGGGGLVSREGGRYMYVVFALEWQARTVSIRERLCLPRRRFVSQVRISGSRRKEEIKVMDKKRKTTTPFQLQPPINAAHQD